MKKINIGAVLASFMAGELVYQMVLPAVGYDKKELLVVFSFIFSAIVYMRIKERSKEWN